MNIIYLTTEDLGKGSGGKVHFWAIAKELNRLGNRLYVVAPDYGTPLACTPEGDNITVYRYRVPGKNALGLVAFEIAILLLLPIFRFRDRIDVMLVRGGGVSVLGGLLFLWARALSIRVVLECNGVSWNEMKSASRSPLLVLAAQIGGWQQAITANVLIGVTPDVLSAYRSLWACQRKCGYSISNGAYALRLPTDKTTSGPVVFAMPSSFSPWHGILELLEATKLLRTKHSFRVLLVGQGQMFDAARQYVIENSLDDIVEFTGLRCHDEVLTLLSKSHVGILLRTDHGALQVPGSPLKLFEYFAAGLAVIVPADNYHSSMNAVYQFGEVVEGPTARHVAAAMERLLRKSRTELNTLGNSNRQLLEREFTWQHVAARVQAVLAGQSPQTESWMNQTVDHTGTESN